MEVCGGGGSSHATHNVQPKMPKSVQLQPNQLLRNCLSVLLPGEGEKFLCKPPTHGWGIITYTEPFKSRGIHTHAQVMFRGLVLGLAPWAQHTTQAWAGRQVQVGLACPPGGCGGGGNVQLKVCSKNGVKFGGIVGRWEGE